MQDTTIWRTTGLHCPNCQSAGLRKLSVAYQEGRFRVDTRTRLGGVVVGEGGPNVVVGRTTTRGIEQTELSKRLSPPAKWSYKKLVSGELMRWQVFSAM